MKRSSIVFLLLLLAACASQPRPEAVRRYAVLASDSRAGAQVVRVEGDRVLVDYEYNDRGRGPKTHSEITLGAGGVPVASRTTGVDYFKVPVDETFGVEGGSAKWKNSAESDEAAANGAFYLSVYGPPEEVALLGKAILRGQQSQLALLPSGHATIEKLGELDLRGRKVGHYELSGLGFTPIDLWLDADLDLFGFVNPYQSLIREGYESDVRRMLAVQDERANARLGELATRLTHRPSHDSLAITNARIFDPVTGTLSAPSTIVVKGNRIDAVGVGLPLPANVETIDARNRVVIPGLWDMHTHLSDTDGLLNIAAGITTVRDLGNDIDAVGALKKKFEDGTLVGPRVILAGIIDGPGPFKAPTNVLVANEEEARKAIDRYASLGYEQIKIYSSVKPELVAPMAAYAHSKGLRVSGHIPAGMIASQAIAAGYDEIQHANMLMLNFMADVTDTRTPARFTAVAERGAGLDLASPEVRAFIADLRARNIVLDPTLAVFESLFVARQGEMSPGYAAVGDRLPPQVRRQYLTGGLPVPEGKDQLYRDSFRRMLELIRAAHEAGVRIVPGTDGMAGFTLHRELELLVEAGLSPSTVLRLATLLPAQITKRDADLGTIAAGKLADFVIVDGDPTTNISDVRKATQVVKDGKVFDARAVYAAIGVR